MHISKEDWPQISSLLDAALDLDAAARREWLDALPSAALRYRSTLERLLSHDVERRFSDATLSGYFDCSIFAAVSVDDVLAGYRLLRQLGQGGMGTVWLAERVDATFKRQVALKLLHPGLAGSTFGERFNRERDILARLDHPGIARLYDAGVADNGQPFLALEYVDGVPITAYCDQQRLPVNARIALFQQVLATVQYAHGQLIVHRDIKPSNIFVRRDGQMCLLDFGIARFLPDSPADNTELTRDGGRVLTLEYASPEQVAGTPVGITSDVYSLGVVLYELLAGGRPYRVQRNSQGALEDAVLSGNFIWPSKASSDAAVAAMRGVSTPRLKRQLAGDIDAIVVKALRTDPHDRYPTSEAFSRDLDRFLRGETVHARRGNKWYRTARFVRRNWVATSTISAVVAAIAIGGAGAFWQAGIARDNEARARAETLRAERERAVAVAVKEFLVGVFRVNDPETAEYAAQGMRSARDVLEEGVLRLRNSFDAQPETRVELYDAVIGILLNLQDIERALALARENVAYAAEHFPKNDERYASAVLREAMATFDAEQPDDARRLAGVVESTLDANGDRDSLLRARLLLFLGTHLTRPGAEGLLDLERAKQGVALLALNGADPSVRAQALVDTAYAYDELRQDQAALDTFDAALSWAHDFQGSDLLRARALGARARVLVRMGNLTEAEIATRAALEALNSLPPTHPEVLQRMQGLGSFLHMYGKRAEGREWLARSVAGMERAFRPRALAIDSARLSALHAAFMDGAVNDVQTALQSLEPLVADGSRMPSLRFDIGWIAARWYIRTRNFERADRMLGTLAKLDGGSRERVALSRATLALLRGSIEEAQEWATRAANAAGSTEARTHTASFAVQDASFHHARLLIESRIAERTGRFSDAIELARRAANRGSTAAREPYADDDSAEDALRLGEAYLAAGDAGAAEQPLTAALAIYAGAHDPSSPLLADARAALARCHASLAAKRQRPAPTDARRSPGSESTAGPGV